MLRCSWVWEGQQSFILFCIDLREVINVTNVRAQTDSTASAGRSRTLIFLQLTCISQLTTSTLLRYFFFHTSYSEFLFSPLLCFSSLSLGMDDIAKISNHNAYFCITIFIYAELVPTQIYHQLYKKCQRYLSQKSDILT